MGWVDESGEHEGWVQGIFNDGELSTGTTCAEGVVFDPVYADGRLVSRRIRPTSEIVALRMVCECGWHGPRVEIADLAPGSVDRWAEPTEDVEEAVFLPPWREHVRPFGALSQLRAARLAVWEAEQALAGYVADARSAGASWGDIARELGVSRQAAQQRYGA